MEPIRFTPSPPYTMGVELELQVVNTRDYNLARGASDLLERLGRITLPGAVKPEITESMIELNSSVHARHGALLAELHAMRDVVALQAGKLNLAICGGGTHPFQQWAEQRIYSASRFEYISDLYGYLAKQFTVFGQHIHIGCGSGDDAIYLVHALGRYVPHFIALSASSPFSQGVDTAFDSSRLNAIAAFPLSGPMPFIESWDELNAYVAKMYRFRIIGSMKDFYWDIRPKPEYGTIEIRVCDTPLTVERAAALAAYAQALAQRLLTERPHRPSRDAYLVYNYNRFQASRFGLRGNFIDPHSERHLMLADDIAQTLEQLAPYAEALESRAPIEELRRSVADEHNDATWLRDAYQRTHSFTDVVRLQARRWAGREQ
ncbi:MAG TPA: YbdK family carboxylate-amine ligase [Burkholderiales bacterium]